MSTDTQLLLAVLQVAREECASNSWDELEPVLEATWERLRGTDAPPWPMVVDEVRASCRHAGYLN